MQRNYGNGRSEDVAEDLCLEDRLNVCQRRLAMKEEKIDELYREIGFKDNELKRQRMEIHDLKQKLSAAHGSTNQADHTQCIEMQTSLNTRINTMQSQLNTANERSAENYNAYQEADLLHNDSLKKLKAMTKRNSDKKDQIKELKEKPYGIWKEWLLNNNLC